MTSRRRVVITGMGVVSAAGSTLDSFWNRLVSGRSAIRRIQRFDVSAYPSQIAAEIDDIDFRGASQLPADWMHRGRIGQYAALAVERALGDASLPVTAYERTGIVIASGLGTGTHAEIVGPTVAAARPHDNEFDWHTFATEVRRLGQPLAAERRTPGSIPALLARHFGLRGPVMSVMTACAGGTQALGDALRWIRNGRAECVVAAGADSELYPMGLASFCLLGALSRGNESPAASSRPFDARRDGFVIGEGGAGLVLEERTHAVKRGAQIYAEIAGFGSACDAYRVTDPHPEGAGAVLAMTRAMADAETSGGEIGYINAHGTSTPANDRIETLAIKRVFGERASKIPISSTKSLIGHPTVAAGAIEAVATVLTLAHQTMHPTINQDTPDPACDLDYVPNHARRASIDVALSNSFAFGGQSAAVVFKRSQH